MQRIEFLSRQLRNVARRNILINSNKSCLDEPTADGWEGLLTRL